MKIQYEYLLLILWMVLIFMLPNEVASISSARSAVTDVLIGVTTSAAGIGAYYLIQRPNTKWGAAK